MIVEHWCYRFNLFVIIFQHAWFGLNNGDVGVMDIWWQAIICSWSSMKITLETFVKIFVVKLCLLTRPLDVTKMFWYCFEEIYQIQVLMLVAQRMYPCYYWNGKDKINPHCPRRCTLSSSRTGATDCAL